MGSSLGCAIMVAALCLILAGMKIYSMRKR